MTNYLLLQTNLNKNLIKPLPIEFVHGFLTAILCSPTPLLPSDWLDILIGDDSEEGVTFESEEQLHVVMNILIELMNSISKSLAGDLFVPLFKPDGTAIAEPDEAQTWCRGFVFGLQVWDDRLFRLPAAYDIVVPFLLIAHEDFIYDENPELREYADKVEQIKKQAVAALADCVYDLADFCQSSEYKTSHKIGRNDECPCGSGKKYKKCCGK